MGTATTVERLSIELTNHCGKGCWFCYNRSSPGGGTAWSADEVVGLVRDCARHGTRAVSFGGGEPLEVDDLLFACLERLRGVVFRSVTTNGLALDGPKLAALLRARPDKVHVSIHVPEHAAEVERACDRVRSLEAVGVRAGVNLLVARSGLDAAAAARVALHEAGIGNDRIVYLPMRGQDTPLPAEVARVAGGGPFQSMTCLGGCARSPRFAAISWDRQAAWCSYTTMRRPLVSLDHEGLAGALAGLGLAFCGGTPA